MSSHLPGKSDGGGSWKLRSDHETWPGCELCGRKARFQVFLNEGSTDLQKRTQDLCEGHFSTCVPESKVDVIADRMRIGEQPLDEVKDLVTFDNRVARKHGNPLQMPLSGYGRGTLSRQRNTTTNRPAGTSQSVGEGKVYQMQVDDKPEVEPRALPVPKGPPAEPDEIAARYVPDRSDRIIGMGRERAAILLTMHTGMPAILRGHTGMAKTKLMQEMHHRLRWPYRSVAGHGNVEVSSLLGQWVAKGVDEGMVYRLGILPFCMKHGIAVGIQEINAVAPEVLVMLHEYLDEGRITLTDLDPDHPDFIIEPHPNFRLYGSMNPPELYPGVRELSPALARRCVVVDTEPLDAEKEWLAVMASVPGIDDRIARNMVSVAQDVRKGADAGIQAYYLSTADLVTWGRFTLFMPPYEAAMLAVVGRAPDEEREVVRARVRVSFEPDPTFDWAAVSESLPDRPLAIVDLEQS